MAQPTELGTERMRHLLFKYAMPAIVAMTAVSLYNIVDSVFIGHFVGPMALGALTIAKPFMDVCAAFGSLVGVGAGALVAIKLGEKNTEAAGKVLGNVVLLNIALSIIVMVIGIIFLKPILIAFGASAETLPMAYDYMLIILLGNVPTHLYFGLNNVLRSSGHPTQAMMATILAVTLNTVLDPIFIIVFDWGVRGAAIATVLSQISAVVWQLTIFSKPTEVLHFHRSIWHIDKRIALDMFSIGLSPFLMNLANCLVVVIINNQLMTYGGDLAIASYGVVNRFIFIFVMVILGFNQGMQPIAGYNYGARQYDRVKRIFSLTSYCATCITATVTIACLAVPQLMARIFTDDPALIESSSHAMRIVGCAFFVVGFQMVTGNLFTSIGMAKKAIFLSLTRQVLFLVPMMLVMPGIWGVDGVWWAMPISDTMAAITAALMLNYQFNRLKSYGDEQPIEQNVEKYSEQSE